MSDSSQEPIDHLAQRALNLTRLQDLGCDPYPHRFDLSDTVAEIQQQHSEKTGEELEAASIRVRTAGRLMAIRGHGKASFGHIQADGVRLQIYVRLDRVGEENYAIYKLLDIGDLIGLEGTMFRTRTNELTLFVDRLEFLSKALLPLPEKYHGLADKEARYRQRYLDLIANVEAREVFVVRSRLVASIRRFMDRHGYLEVETPMMQTLAGGATARPFETFHEALGIPLYLRIAPELYLKRLIVGGLDRVYEINRNFRNEGISRQHNPEFTMLEFYAAYFDYNDLMDFTEELLRSAVEEVTGGLQLDWGEEQLDFSQYLRVTMVEAIQQNWPGDEPPTEAQLLEEKSLRALLGETGGVDGSLSWGKMLGELFERVAEDKLVQPTFVYDYPVELSPLSKRKDSDPRFVERFELYAAGMELANAYSELNDPAEQEDRFREQLQQFEQGDLEAHRMDDDYVTALKHGMPPTGGEGIGIDRLTMLLTDSQSIREVILFPHLRPRDGRTDENAGQE